MLAVIVLDADDAVLSPHARSVLGGRHRGETLNPGWGDDGQHIRIAAARHWNRVASRPGRALVIGVLEGEHLVTAERERVLAEPGRILVPPAQHAAIRVSCACVVESDHHRDEGPRGHVLDAGATEIVRAALLFRDGRPGLSGAAQVPGLVDHAGRKVRGRDGDTSASNRGMELGVTGPPAEHADAPAQGTRVVASRDDPPERPLRRAGDAKVDRTPVAARVAIKTVRAIDRIAGSPAMQRSVVPDAARVIQTDGDVHEHHPFWRSCLPFVIRTPAAHCAPIEESAAVCRTNRQRPNTADWVSAEHRPDPRADSGGPEIRPDGQVALVLGPR